MIPARQLLAMLMGGGVGGGDDDPDDDVSPASASVGGASGSSAAAPARVRRTCEDAINDPHPWEIQQRRAMQTSTLSASINRLDSLGKSAEAHASLLRRNACAGFTSNGHAGMTRAHMASAASLYLPSRLANRDLVPSSQTRQYCTMFTARGNLLICGSQDEFVTILKTDTLQPLKRVEATDVSWAVSSVDVSPDEQFMAYSTLNEVVHIVNIHGEEELHDAISLAERGSATGGTGSRRRWGGGFGVFQIKFSAGGTELVAGTNDNSLIVADVERKSVVVRVKNAHSDDINTVAFADAHFKSDLIVTGSDDKLIKLWDRRMLGGDGGGGEGAEGVASASRRNSSSSSSSSSSGSSGGGSKPSGYLPGHAGGITSVSAKGDGVYIVSNSKDQTAKLWDLRKMVSSSSFASLAPVADRFPGYDYRMQHYPGDTADAWMHPHDASVMTFRGHAVQQTLIRAYFSPLETTAQRYIYTGSADGRICMYDALTGELEQTLVYHRGAVRDVSWHPHLPLLASASFDGATALWTYGEKEARVQAELKKERQEVALSTLRRNRESRRFQRKAEAAKAAAKHEVEKAASLAAASSGSKNANSSSDSASSSASASSAAAEDDSMRPSSHETLGSSSTVSSSDANATMSSSASSSFSAPSSSSESSSASSSPTSSSSTGEEDSYDTDDDFDFVQETLRRKLVAKEEEKERRKAAAAAAAAATASGGGGGSGRASAAAASMQELRRLLFGGLMSASSESSAAETDDNDDDDGGEEEEGGDDDDDEADEDDDDDDDDDDDEEEEEEEETTGPSESETGKDSS